MNQQLSIIKTLLGTSLTSYVKKFSSEMETQLNMLSVKVTVERHISQADRALDAMQRNLDLTIESALNAQKGILQP
jgi:hypothetical protein